MIINGHHNQDLSPQNQLLHWANSVDELLMYEPVSEGEIRLYNFIHGALLLIHQGRSLTHWANSMKRVTAHPVKTISERLLYEIIAQGIRLVDQLDEVERTSGLIVLAMPEKELPHERKIQPNLN